MWKLYLKKDRGGEFGVGEPSVEREIMRGERDRGRKAVNFQRALAVKCRESDLLYALLLKMATQHPKTRL